MQGKQLPKLYATYQCDTVRGQEPRIRDFMPCVRLEEGGHEIAIIVNKEHELQYIGEPLKKASMMELATLFAAAPELLDALRAMVYEGTPEAFAQAHAAIEKAGY